MPSSFKPFVQRASHTHHDPHTRMRLQECACSPNTHARTSKHDYKLQQGSLQLPSQRRSHGQTFQGDHFLHCPQSVVRPMYRAPKRSAVSESDDDEHDIIDLYSGSSGDEAVRVAAVSAAVSEVSVDSESEESDSGRKAKGTRTVLYAKCCSMRVLIASARVQVQLCPCVCLSSFRGWSPSVWLLVARGCMHAHDARITAKR